MYNSNYKRRHFWTLTGTFTTSTIIFCALTAPLYTASLPVSTYTNTTTSSQEPAQAPSLAPRTQLLGNTMRIDDCVTDITYAPTYGVNAYHSKTLDFSMSNNQLTITNSSPDNTLMIVDHDLTPVNCLEDFNVPTQAVYFKSVVDETAMMTWNDLHLPLQGVANMPQDTFQGVWANAPHSQDMRFYRLAQPTMVHLEPLGNIDYNMFPSEFIHDRDNYAHKLKLQIHNALPSTLANAQITLEPNDQLGQVYVHVNLGAGIVKQTTMQLGELPTQSYVLEGFYRTSTKVDEASRFTVPWSRTSFNPDAPYNADIFNSLSGYTDQFLYPSAFSMPWAKDTFQKTIIGFIANQVAGSVPENFSAKNIRVADLKPNNAEGIISVKFFLDRYIDNKGNLETVPPDNSASDENYFLINFTGFKQLLGATSLPETYDLKVGDPGYNIVYEEDNESLKNKLEDIIISLIKNAPVNFKLPVNRNQIELIPVPNLEKGTCDFTVRFQGYFDEDLNYNSDNIFEKTIKIRGFKSSIMTEVRKPIPNELGDSSKLAQEFFPIKKNPSENINDTEQAKHIKGIFKDNNLIVNPPPDFSLTTDLVIVDNSIEFNNREGTLSFKFYLNKYVDNKGDEHIVNGHADEKPIIESMTFFNFKKVLGPTKFNTTDYPIGNPTETVYPYVEGGNYSKLINLLKPHLINTLESVIKPTSDGFEETKLLIEEDTVEVDVAEGVIKVTPIIQNYFNDDKQLTYTTKEKKLPQVTISGFKKVEPTSVPDIPLDLGNRYVLASNLLNKKNSSQLKSYILNNVKFPPPNMTDEDIIIDWQNSTYSNLDGSITLKFQFQRWYDSQGQLWMIPSDPQTFKIIGYRKIEPTNFTPTLKLSNDHILASSEFDLTKSPLEFKNEKKWKEIVLNNLINNIVPNTDEKNIQITNLSFNNLEGTINFHVALNRFFNSDGVITDSNFSASNIPTANITIEGYKQVIPTQLPENMSVWEDGVSSQLPDKYYKNEAWLKDIIFQHLAYLPDDFTLDNIQISNVTYNNLVGSISLRYNITNYYDKNGLVSNSLPFDLSATISNFKSIGATEINQNVSLNNISEEIASSQNVDDLKNLVYNNYSKFFTNLPSYKFTKDDIVIDPNSIIAKNNLGTVEFLLSTKTYYDIHGQLIEHTNSSPLTPQRVRVVGFSQISETVVNQGFTIPGQTDNLPTTISKEKILKLIYANRFSIFAPLPETFNENSIEIANPERFFQDNLDGTITLDITINNYFNSEGNQVDDSPKTIHNLLLRGFKSIAPTVIDTTVKLQNVVIDATGTTISQVMATHITDDQLKEVLIKNYDLFVHNQPTDFIIEEVSILKNSISNLLGTLIAKITYKNFYDASGNLNSTPHIINIRCNGFQQVSPTIVIDSFDVSDKSDLSLSSLLPTEMTTTAIVNLFLTYQTDIFENLPIKLESSKQIVVNPSASTTIPNDVICVIHSNPINAEGEIILNIKLYRYFDEQAELKVGKPSDLGFEPLQHQITLTGFKSISPTTIKESIIIEDPVLANKLPTDVDNEDLKKYLISHQETLITSIPKGFTKSNIYIDELTCLNERGIIYAKVSLDRYYNDQSILIEPSDNKKYSQTVTFSGFRINTQSTYIKPVLYLDSAAAKNIIPEQVTPNLFVNYVWENHLIVNPVDGFNPDTDIVNASIVEVNNLEGYVVGKVSLKKYYDSHGNVVQNPPVADYYTQVVTIYGFKSVTPTNLTPYYNSSIFSNKLPSEVREDYLKTTLRNLSATLIEGTPPTFNPERDIVKIDIVSADNIKGTISAYVYLNNYYNSKGNLINLKSPEKPDQLAKLKPWSITLAGFKTQNPTTIHQIVNLTSFTDRPISDFTSEAGLEELKEYIFHNPSLFFTNLPLDGVNAITKNDIELNILISDNLQGQMSVEIKLNKYVNSLGQLVTVCKAGGTACDANVLPLKQVVLLKGFKTINPTTTNPQISPSNYNNNAANTLTNLFPSDIAPQQIVDFIIANQNHIIINPAVPLTNDNFSEKNIISLVPFNSDGILKVKYKLSQYYNIQGTFIDAKDQPELAKTCTLDIIDLKKAKATTAVNYFTTTKFNDTLPQKEYLNLDLLRDLVLDNKEQIFTAGLPQDLASQDIKISKTSFSNLDGTISFTMELGKFYDSAGNLITNPHAGNLWIKNLTIGGFATVKPTLFNRVLTAPAVEASKTPTEFVADHPQLNEFLDKNKSAIFSNLSSLKSFTADSINVIKVQPLNAAGKVVVTYTVTNYFDANGVLTSAPSPQQVLEISGFASISPTVINSSVKINERGKKPSAFLLEEGGTGNPNDILKKYVLKQPNLFFENLPPQPEGTPLDITVSNADINDKNGQIIFKLTLKDYYDEQGVLQHDSQLSRNVILSGFATQAPTYIGNANAALTNVNDSTIHAVIGNDYQTIDEFLTGNINQQREKILSLIRSSIINSADLSGNKGVIGFSDFTIDYNQATITVLNLRITDFYQASNGLLINTSDGVSFNLVISGFKKTIDAPLTPTDIIIYVAIAISCALILVILGYFIYKFARRKYLKV